MKCVATVGFALTEEVEPGIFVPTISERRYYADITRVYHRYSESSVNGEITVGNQVSIVADAFANQNLFNMRYVVFMGAKWLISNIDVQRPRLILTLGGLYKTDDEPERQPEEDAENP